MLVGRLFDDYRLDERSLGELEQTRQRHISAYASGDLTYAPRNGESYEDLTRRCLSFLVDLAVASRQRSRPLKCLVSTHVGPMRIIWGIVHRESDPVQVLSKHFDNTQVERMQMCQLTWPHFLANTIGM